MSAPSGAVADPLDDIGNLLQTTMSVLGTHGDEATSDKPRHPLNDVFGGGGQPGQARVDASMDLDLLGASTAVATGPGGPKGAPSMAMPEDIPLRDASDNPFQQLAQDDPEEDRQDGVFLRDLNQRAQHDMGGSSPPAMPAAGAGPSTSAGGSPLLGAAVEPSLIRVWVKDPERQEGANKLGIKSTYFTYKVRTDSTYPGLRADNIEVRRRFSEFDTLYKVVKAQYRGYIIPPLPEKSFIDSKLGQEDFLRLRRADLQAFIRGIVAHPVLRNAEVLKLFLLQPGELHYNPAWTGILSAAGHHGEANDGLSTSSAASSTAKAAASLTSLVTWVRHSVFASSARRELDEDEVKLRQAKDLMRDLERLLQLSCESARHLCHHMDQMAGDFHELGRNMGMLSKWEEALQAQSGAYTEAGHSAGKRASDCRGMGMSNVKQHGLWKNASIKTAASLVSLHDYYILMPEAVAALEEREKCLDHIHAMEDELNSTQGQLSKGAGAKSPIGGRDKRAYQLTSNAERLEEQLKSTRELYQVIKRRNQEELLRLHLAREQDFRAMMGTFAAIQAQLVQASADMWKAAAVQIGAGSVSPPTEDTAGTSAADDEY